MLLAQENPLLNLRRNQRILIIDDNQNTLARVASELNTQGFSRITPLNNPNLVNQYLLEAKSRNTPYTCLVLDLYMKEKLGSQVLKDLIDLTPAIIIHSASTMNPHLSKITKAMHEFSTQRIQELIREHTTSMQDLGMSLAPVVFHSKRSQVPLIQAIDAAILLKQNNFGNLKEFIKEYHPNLFSISIPKEILHNFAEELNNLVKNLKNTFTEFVAKDTQWYTCNKEKIDYIFATSNVDFLNISEQDAKHLLHEIVNILEVLTPLTSTNETHQFLTDWKRNLDNFKPILNKFYKDLDDYYTSTSVLSDYFNPLNSLYRIFHHKLNSSNLPKINTTIYDPKHMLRSCLENLFLAIYKTLTSSDFISLEHYQKNKNPSLVSHLKDINCGSFLEITISNCANDKNTTAVFEKKFDILLPLLGELFKNKLGFFKLRNKKDCLDASFSLYIKLSEDSSSHQTIDLATDDNKLCSIPSKNREDIIYFQNNLGQDKNIISIAMSANSLFHYQKQVYYKYQDQILISAGYNHFEASINIAKFIATQNNSLNLVDLANMVHNTAIRSKMVNNIVLVENTPQFKPEIALKALADLGLAQDKFQLSNIEERMFMN